MRTATMSTPENHLSPALSHDAINNLLTSISLPPPTSITPLQVTAAFHSIYLITYPLSASPSLFPANFASSLPTPSQDRVTKDGGNISLILRVSGTHIPKLKTRNEAAVMKWVRENTSIPVPAVLRWDDSAENPIGREFTLLEKVPGKSVDAVYNMLSEEAKMGLVRQLTGSLVELNAHQWTHVGGLHLDGQGRVEAGPLLDDNFWMEPDIEKYWAGSGLTFSDLNPIGPFREHWEMLRAALECGIKAINNHKTLSWLRPLIPRLEDLIIRLPFLDSPYTKRLILAHKDLHFANVMIDEDSCTITGILDWEFAAVVPSHRWDPVRAFLWSGVYSDEATAEKNRLRLLFEEELTRIGIAPWWEECHVLGIEGKNDEVEGTRKVMLTGEIDEGKMREEVDTLWTVVKFLRALVEVCPKGQREELVEGWKREIEKGLDTLLV